MPSARKMLWPMFMGKPGFARSRLGFAIHDSRFAIAGDPPEGLHLPLNRSVRVLERREHCVHRALDFGIRERAVG
jgi:hypothetical protein